jgi:hypothetical protein
MAKMRARIMSANVWVMRVGSRASGKQRASLCAMPSRRSAMESSITHRAAIRGEASAIESSGDLLA